MPVIFVTPEAVIVPEVAAAIAVKSVAAAVPVTVTVKLVSIDDSSELLLAATIAAFVYFGMIAMGLKI